MTHTSDQSPSKDSKLLNHPKFPTVFPSNWGCTSGRVQATGSQQHTLPPGGQAWFCLLEDLEKERNVTCVKEYTQNASNIHVSHTW